MIHGIQTPDFIYTYIYIYTYIKSSNHVYIIIYDLVYTNMAFPPPRKMEGREWSFELSGSCIFTGFSGGKSKCGHFMIFRQVMGMVGYQLDPLIWKDKNILSLKVFQSIILVCSYKVLLYCNHVRSNPFYFRPWQLAQLFLD